MLPAKVVLLARAPPYMQLWNVAYQGSVCFITHRQKLVSQNSEFVGFSRLHAVPLAWHARMMRHAAAYTRLALRTRSWSLCDRLGRPSGCSGDLRGYGPPSKGISLALLAVPQGTPRCTYLHLGCWTHSRTNVTLSSFSRLSLQMGALHPALTMWSTPKEPGSPWRRSWAVSPPVPEQISMPK